MENEILVHHGVKGMRWGVRRYQNEDGSLTDAGRKHYNVGKAKVAGKQYPSYDEMQQVVKQKGMEKAYDKAIAPDNSKINQAKNVADQTRNLANKAQDSYRDYKRSKQPPIDTSKMSNRELQEAITRMNLENQYTDLVRKRENIKSGKDYVDKALEVTKTVAEVASVGLAVYALFKKA